MLTTNKEVAIIGGGPGGLTLARLLQLKGVAVKVYERDTNKETRLQGGSLDLHTESGLAALDKAGLLEAFKLNYRPGAGIMRVADNQAIIHFDEHIEGKTEAFGDKHHRPEIDRGPLRNILLESLAPDTVVWDSHVVSVEKEPGKWKVIFKNGETIHADLIIGADGANSKIKPYISQLQPIWTGIMMLEGSIKDAEKSASRLHTLLKGGKLFAYGNEKSLILSSKENGSFGFLASWKTSENWPYECGIDFKDNKQVLAWFKATFPEWSPIWYELFEREDTVFTLRPQYCMPLDYKWTSKSDITLIGDAAHWMPPFAGEGVNMAMLDALQLSEALIDPSMEDMHSAIARYEQQMFKRFAIVGRGTLFNTEWMHQSGALKAMLNMFGKNKIKQGIFIGKMAMNIYIAPRIRKIIGLTSRQEAFT